MNSKLLFMLYYITYIYVDSIIRIIYVLYTYYIRIIFYDYINNRFVNITSVIFYNTIQYKKVESLILLL